MIFTQIGFLIDSMPLLGW